MYMSIGKVKIIVKKLIKIIDRITELVYSTDEVIVMAISKKIKSLLMETDKKQSDLMEVLNMGSKQSLSNKFAHERWSAEDLVKIADFCGCKLAFVLPNGERITIDADNSAE